jgi:hypothetical protein
MSENSVYVVSIGGETYELKARSRMDARHRAASKYKHEERSGPHVGVPVSQMAGGASVEAEKTEPSAV